MSNQGVALKTSSNNNGEYLASIDAGTSSVRVILFHKNAEIAFSEQMELKLEAPRPGWVEQSAQEIYDKITQCMQAVLDKNQLSASQIKAVGITNQRETTILWDAATSEPVHNAIVWQDTRTSDIVQSLTQTLGSKDALREKCGLPLSPYFSATKIKWLYDHVDTVAALSSKKQLKFGTVDCWLLWKLLGAGQASHFIDVSNASRTMLMNLHTLDWDASLCATFGIPMHILPTIKPSSFAFGDIASGPFQGVPITGVLGDQQAATLGQLCIHPGDAKNTYGTGAFLVCNTGTSLVHSRHGLLTTVLWQLDSAQPAVYGLEGSVAVAGQAVQFLRDNLGVVKSAKECSQLAAQCDDLKDEEMDVNDRVYFVTAFSGLYSPYWRNDARGLLYGLTMHTQKKTVCRAALEATCFRTCEILEAMKQDTSALPNMKFVSLKVDGGMTQSDVMLQIQADLLQIPVIRPEMVETTALGAAIAAGLKCGFWESLQQVQHCMGAKRVEFEPSITAGKAKRLQIGWKDAIQRSFGNGNGNGNGAGLKQRDSIVVIKDADSERGAVNGHVLLAMCVAVLTFTMWWNRNNRNDK